MDDGWYDDGIGLAAIFVILGTLALAVASKVPAFYFPAVASYLIVLLIARTMLVELLHTIRYQADDDAPPTPGSRPAHGTPLPRVRDTTANHKEQP
jgi:hypothetical protein